MKRYISSIIIVAVVVFSIGTFYIYSAVSASPFPHLKIVGESGNEKEIKSLIITGDYQLGQDHDNFELSLKSTVYNSERSFLDKLDNETNKIKQLRKQYRNFMRGKMGLDSFYEDQDILIYADTNSSWNGMDGNTKLEISMLDKKDKKKTSFEIPLSNQFRYAFVQDVQRVGKQLKVITENMRKQNINNENENNELHVYTINYSNKKLVNDEVIKSYNIENVNTYSQFQKIPVIDETAPSKYVLFNNSLIKSTDQGEEEVVKSELIAYNTETSEKEIIKLPKKINIDQISSFNGDIIYIVSRNTSGLKVISYNFESQKVISEIKIQIQNTENMDIEDIVYKIKNEKLFIITSNKGNKKNANVLVYDIDTGESLFKGKIVENDQKDNETKKKSSIWLYDIDFN
ncbi:hypothetical protein ACQKP0_18400 [Heyndrickxia sp. NPDC080065]|uniref:hypothetical protein n=1 Tax=Heyndrickxia sp. NPDC080065 TaxID=3390568 RepID=UPI003CFC827F